MSGSEGGREGEEMVVALKGAEGGKLQVRVVSEVSENWLESFDSR